MAVAQIRSVVLLSTVLFCSGCGFLFLPQRVRQLEDTDSLSQMRCRRAEELHRACTSSMDVLRQGLECLESRVSDVDRRLPHPSNDVRPVSLTLIDDALNLGSVATCRGGGETRALVPIRHTDATPVVLRVTSDFDLTAGRVLVPHKVLAMPNADVSLTLVFEGIPGSRRFVGTITFQAADPLRPSANAVLHITGTVDETKPYTRPENNSVCVWTWPPGDSVYIEGYNADSPSERRYLAESPACFTAPPGVYRLTLFPNHHHPASAWAQPEGQVLTIAADDHITKCFTTAVEKRLNEPLLLRVLWLDGDAPLREQLVAATTAAPQRFVFDFEEWQLFLTDELARRGLRVTDEDVPVLYKVMRKTGFIRWRYPEGDAGLTIRVGHPEEPDFVAIDASERDTP